MSTEGLSNSAMVQTFTAEDAITYGGTPVMPGTAAGKVKKLTQGNIPFGFAFSSTKDRVTGVATANVPVGVIPLIDGLEIYMPLPATHAAISVFDPVCVSATAGTVVKRDGGTFTDVILGYALAAKTQDEGGFVKVRVTKITATAVSAAMEIHVPLVNETQLTTSNSLATLPGWTKWIPAGWTLANLSKIEIELEYAQEAGTGDIDLYNVTDSAKIKDLVAPATTVAHTVTRVDVTTEVKAATSGDIIGIQSKSDGTNDNIVYKATMVMTYVGV